MHIYGSLEESRSERGKSHNVICRMSKTFSVTVTDTASCPLQSVVDADCSKDSLIGR